jgi:hypothetical protein
MLPRSALTPGVCAMSASLLLIGDVAAAGASPPPAGSKVAIIGGTAAQRQLGRLTALRVGGVTLSRVVFRSPTRILRTMHVHGAVLVVSSRGEDTLRSEWDQELYVGAYLGLMAGWPKGAVAAAAFDHTEGPVSRLRPYEVFGSNPPAARVALLRQRLTAAAAREKARVVELRVAATPARAIALTVRVADPAAFLKHRAKTLLDIFARPGVPLLGYYLAAENERGKVVWATFQLPGTGAVFTIPRLDACSPVSHSDAVGYQPPRCPAH